MNFTVCLMNAEYVEYGTLSVYRWTIECCTYYLYTTGILHTYLVNYKPCILQKKHYRYIFFLSVTKKVAQSPE